jgi:hypothetical protein
VEAGAGGQRAESDGPRLGGFGPSQFAWVVYICLRPPVPALGSASPFPNHPGPSPRATSRGLRQWAATAVPRTGRPGAVWGGGQRGQTSHTPWPAGRSLALIPPSASLPPPPRHQLAASVAVTGATPANLIPKSRLPLPALPPATMAALAGPPAGRKVGGHHHTLLAPVRTPPCAGGGFQAAGGGAHGTSPGTAGADGGGGLMSFTGTPPAPGGAADALAATAGRLAAALADATALVAAARALPASGGGAVPAPILRQLSTALRKISAQQAGALEEVSRGGGGGRGEG